MTRPSRRSTPHALVALTVAALLATLGVAPAPGSAQPAPPAAPPHEPSPDLGELVPEAAALTQRGEHVPELVSALTDLDALRSSLDAVVAELTEQSEHMHALRTSNAYGYERIATIRAAVRETQAALAPIEKSSARRLAELTAATKTWTEEKTAWTARREQLRGEPARATLRPAVDGALRTTASALERLRVAEGPLIELQQKTAAARTRSDALLESVETALRGLRGQLFRRSRPSMLDPAFYEQFDSTVGVQLRRTLVDIQLPDAHFLAAEGWVVGLQLALSLFIALAIRRRRRRGTTAERWAFLTRRPFAAGFCVGVAALWPLYGEVPPIWQIVLWVAAGLGAARLAAGLVAHAWRRRLIYILAALFLLSQLLGQIGFPMQLFRLYVALVGLGGGLLCGWRAVANIRRDGPTAYAQALRVGAAVFLAVFVAEFAGFHDLAAHVLEAAIKTTFLGLFASMFGRLLKGAIEVAVASPLLQRVDLLRKHGGIIANRLGRLVNAAVFLLLLGAVLQIWRVYDTVGDAVGGVLALGFTLGGTPISIALVLAAAAVLYGALVTSWLMQRVLEDQWYPRRQIELGVQVAINRLIHYAFVLLGFLFAVSALGLELKNLTILAGAFGIGVGFGLQTIVSNFVSGLILLFERPIKVGDLVQLGEQWGTVIKLGLRATVVRTTENSEVIVPNSDLISNQVTNWTRSDRNIRLTLPVGIAYGSDVPRAIAVLAEVAASNPGVVSAPTPQVLFQGFGASSLDFELRVWLADVDARFSVRSELNQAIDQGFRAAHIEIAFPQQDLHLRSVDEGVQRAFGRGGGSRSSST